MEAKRIEQARPSTDGWSEFRRAWEIIRRRSSIREAFGRYAPESYRLLSTIPDYDGPSSDEPGFLAMAPEISEFGMIGIPNPRIGDQPQFGDIVRQKVRQEIPGIGEDYLSIDSWQQCFILEGSVAFIVQPR